LGERVATVMIHTAYFEEGVLKREELSFSNKQIAWSLDVQRGVQFSSVYNIPNELIDKINSGEGAVQIAIYVEEGIGLKIPSRNISSNISSNNNISTNNISNNNISNNQFNTSSAQYLNSNLELFQWFPGFDYNGFTTTSKNITLYNSNNYGIIYGGSFFNNNQLVGTILINNNFIEFGQNVYAITQMNNSLIVASDNIYKIDNLNFSSPEILYRISVNFMRVYNKDLYYMNSYDGIIFCNNEPIFFPGSYNFYNFDIDPRGIIYIAGQDFNYATLQGSVIKISVDEEILY
jgi:hypothetical protein